jgi:hypothetical protein
MFPVSTHIRGSAGVLHIDQTTLVTTSEQPRGSLTFPSASADRVGLLDCFDPLKGGRARMDVIATGEGKDCWRWEIRHAGRVVKQSAKRFSSLVEALEEGKRQAVELSSQDHRTMRP